MISFAEWLDQGAKKFRPEEDDYPVFVVCKGCGRGEKFSKLCIDYGMTKEEGMRLIDFENAYLNCAYRCIP